jgi:hypothetical protein
MGRGEPGDSYPIINEWGGARTVPSQVRAVPEPKVLRCNIFFYES